MGVYRLQAQLKVMDFAVAHPPGATSARIDTPVRYCSFGGLGVGSHRLGCVVLLGQGGGGLENTVYGDARIERRRLAGIREGGSWLFRLPAISTAAIWGPSRSCHHGFCAPSGFLPGRQVASQLF